jgi:hypothetical protein
MDIEIGEEITYDYGIAELTWEKVITYIIHR